MGRNLTNLPISASFQYLTQVSGSELTDGLGADIDSLNLDITGTATTASYVAAANVDGTVANATSASYATTASFALNQTDTTYDLDSIQVGDDVAITLVGSDSSLDTVTLVAGTDITLTDDGSANITIDASVPSFDTGSLLVTGSVSDATITLEKGDGSTFDLTVDNVANATSASQAETAVTASFLPSNTRLNITDITASNASFTSASIGYLQTITGSAKIIGDAFIILNNNTPTERYAGLVVQDSGSTNNTASLQFDGQTNDWFYQYTDDGGATDEYGVVMFGPGYNTQGAHVYPSNNTILKGTGDHHIVDSSITDDGTLVTIDANVSASGYVSASSFIGDGSQLTGLPDGDPFPYTGDAVITGSIITGDGSSTINDPFSAVIASSGSSINSAGKNHVVLAGSNNSIQGSNSVYGGSVVMGRNNTVGTGKGAFMSLIAGSGNTIAEANTAVVIGRNHTMNELNVGYGFIVGGDGNTKTSGFNAGVVGGEDNTLSNGRNSIILGGDSNTISDDNAGIVAGVGNTASHDRSVVIGGSSLSTSKADEVVVPDLTATNISASGYVSASSFIGDGSQLTGNDDGKFNDGAGFESIVGQMLSSGSNNSPQGFLFGSGSSIAATGVGHVVLGGTDNSITTSGGNSTIIGGYNNEVTGDFGGGIFGGRDNTSAAYFSAIAGGSGNSIDGQYTGILAGQGNTIGNNNWSTIVGGQNNTVSGGTHTTIVGGNNSSVSAVYGGNFNTVNHTNSGTHATVVGVEGGSTSVSYCGNFASFGGQMTGGGDTSVLVGGYVNTISNGNRNAILGGQSNTMSTDSDRSVILAGQNNTVTHSGSVILGGDGLSTSKHHESVVENLSVYGETFISSSTLGTGSFIDNLGQEAIVTGSQVQHIVNLSQTEYDALTPDDNTLYVIDGSETLGDTVVSGSLIGEVGALSIASTTASMDCSAGNYFTLTLANGVDTHLDATNLQVGQTINLKLTNNATGAGTISFAPEFDFEGGTAFTATATTSAVDILTFVSFDGTSLQTVGVKNFS